MFDFGEQYMKQFYDNWQQTFGNQLEKMVNDQQFISQMAKAISASMSGKSMLSKSINESMAMMNIPSREDIILIQQKLTDIEERIIDHSEFVEDELEDLKTKIAQIESKIKLPAKNSSVKTRAKKSSATAKKSTKKTSKK